MCRKHLYLFLYGLLLPSSASAQNPAIQIQEIAKITGSDSMADDRTGPVSIDGSIAVLGRNHDTEPLSIGAVYVFQRSTGSPETWDQIAKLTSDAPFAGDNFGASVAVDGDTIVVGAIGEVALGASGSEASSGGAGAAYIFRRDHGGPDNWGQVAKVTGSDTVEMDNFGISVAVDGETVLVGAYVSNAEGIDSGSVYVFERDHGGLDNWGQVTKIVADDTSAFDWFGFALSLDGDRALIGAPGENTDLLPVTPGAAYLFERNRGGTDNWGQVAKVSSGNPSYIDHYGVSVSLDGDTAAVGAFEAIDGVPGSGAVYLYEKDLGGIDTWGQVARIAPDSPVGGLFGNVFLTGNRLFVGGREAFNIDSNVGTVSIFERDQGGPDNWGRVARIFASDNELDDDFGTTLSVSDDTIMLGAPRDDDRGVDAGAAYIFRSIGPHLDIPAGIPAVSGTAVTVPVALDTRGDALASLAFAVDYDPACLSFDPSDTSPADGIPDAVSLTLPAGFGAFVAHDLGDTDGELDFVLFASDPTTTTFDDGVLAWITFTSICASNPTEPLPSPLLFSTEPSPSFGSPDAASIAGSSSDGSVEIFSGARGDCNGDGLIDAADIPACLLEVFDGDGALWTDTLVAVPFPGSPVGCDANGDTLVDAGDLSCKAILIHDASGLCVIKSGQETQNGPRLSIPATLDGSGTTRTVTVTFEPGDHEINSLVFSLDYDQTRLVFDNESTAVRFLGQPVGLQSVTFNAEDTDGELDVVLADLTSLGRLSGGAVLEVDLRSIVADDGDSFESVQFSSHPTVSFGDVFGRSVLGSGQVVTSEAVIFADGFESGDLTAWTGSEP